VARRTPLLDAIARHEAVNRRSRVALPAHADLKPTLLRLLRNENPRRYRVMVVWPA